MWIVCFHLCSKEEEIQICMWLYVCIFNLYILKEVILSEKLLKMITYKGIEKGWKLEFPECTLFL